MTPRGAFAREIVIMMQLLAVPGFRHPRHLRSLSAKGKLKRLTSRICYEASTFECAHELPLAQMENSPLNIDVLRIVMSFAAAEYLNTGRRTISNVMKTCRLLNHEGAIPASTGASGSTPTRRSYPF